MSKTLRPLLNAAVAIVAMASLAAPALADTAWQAHHPRREQVNNRLGNQNRRIHQEVRGGGMTHARAARLHRADHHIRMQERRMAHRNGGYVTKRQQARLNREENRVSRRIGR